MAARLAARRPADTEGESGNMLSTESSDMVPRHSRARLMTYGNTSSSGRSSARLGGRDGMTARMSATASTPFTEGNMLSTGESVDDVASAQDDDPWAEWEAQVQAKPTTYDHFDSRFPQLSFVGGATFHSVVGVVIVLNGALLGLETDIPWDGWSLVQEAFLVFFVAELALRVLYEGAHFCSFAGDVGWNVFDSAVVGCGALESWIIPFFHAEHRRHGHSLLLRCLRLLRLLRLVRVFRMSDHLRKFVDAFLDTLPTLAWIFSIVALLCYVTSIGVTRELGHLDPAETAHLTDEDREKLAEYFGTIASSMFTLFRVISMDNWHEVAVPAIKYSPLWRVFFIAFIALFSWTMISLLTAVVSDYMLAATADLEHLEAKRAHAEKMQFIEYLRQSFFSADTDGDCCVDRGEFVRWAAHRSTIEHCNKAGLEVTKEDLVFFFDILDVDGSQVLSADEFVDGLARAQDSLGVKHMLKLEHSFACVERKLGMTAKSVDQIGASVAHMNGRKQMSTVSEQLDHMASQFPSLLKDQAAVLTGLSDLCAQVVGLRLPMRQCAL